jgi:hypothetical protein
MKNAVIWDVTSFRLIDTSVSKEPAAFIFRVENSSTLKMKVVGSYEMLIPLYQAARRHIPEDRNLHVYSHENFVSS